jgi:hypothetical protein
VTLIRRTALLAATAAGAAFACVPAALASRPPIPTIPPGVPLPNLGRPDDTARFNVIVEGFQKSTLTVDGNRFSGRIPGCDFKFEYTITESWNFFRGRGTTFVFERYGPLILFKRLRGGAASNDTSFVIRGGITKKATGGFSETGAPPCRGSRPVSQESCGSHNGIASPVALTWNNRHLRLERSPSASRYKNPAEKCGNSPFGSVGSTFPYPLLENVTLDETIRIRPGRVTFPPLRRLSRDMIFGGRRVILLHGLLELESEQTGEVASKTTGETSATVRLVRQGG